MLHEDPSAHKPWTKTIFGGVVVVAFALVVVVALVVAFVAVAMPCEAPGSIKVVLLFSVLAKPGRGAELAISVVVRNIEIAKLIF